MKDILIVVDMQNDFLTGTLAGKYAEDVTLPAVTKKVADHLAARHDVIFTLDTHGNDYGDTIEGKALPEHCMQGTDGWELAPELKAAVSASGAEGKCKYVCKKSFGSVAESNVSVERTGGKCLTDAISEIAAGEEFELTFCGVCTDICVVSDALICRAAFPEAKIKVIGKLCGGTTPNAHFAALDVMRKCMMEVI